MKDELLFLENIPREDVLVFFNKLLEAYSEDQKTRREIAKINALKETLITEIINKYTFYKSVFDKLFAERQTILIKHFELIDIGIEKNNREYILTGLQGLTRLIITSPFSDIEKLSKILEANKRIVL